MAILRPFARLEGAQRNKSDDADQAGDDHRRPGRHHDVRACMGRNRQSRPDLGRRHQSHYGHVGTSQGGVLRARHDHDAHAEDAEAIAALPASSTSRRVAPRAGRAGNQNCRPARRHRRDLPMILHAGQYGAWFSTQDLASAARASCSARRSDILFVNAPTGRSSHRSRQNASQPFRSSRDVAEGALAMGGDPGRPHVAPTHRQRR